MTPGSWLLVSPILVALAAALGALVTDAFASPRGALHAGTAGLALAAGLFAFAASREAAIVSGVRVGGMQGMLGALGCLIAVAALLAGEQRMRDWPHAGQVTALVAFSAVGSVVLAGSFELPTFVVALELIGLTGYALVAAARTTRAYEAAMKYFVQGAVATGLLAYGVAILFGAFGVRLAFTTLAAPVTPAVTAAVVLLVCALAFKLGAFPFHSWAPDAYETAPASVTAYLATFPKLAALLALAALLLTYFSGHETVWTPLVAAFAAASIVAGNLAALAQTSFRRMLAYSGIAQIGYALVGVAVGNPGYSAVVLLGVFYSLAAAGAFLSAEAAGEGVTWDGSIAGMAGFGRRRPLLAASLAVCLLSLTGIPLTAGFWGKLLVFKSATPSMLWLVVLGVIGSVVSFGYYGGVLRSVYLDEAPAREPEPSEAEAPALEPTAALEAHSVGAMAAQSAAQGRTAEVIVALIALLLVAGGLAPLVWGTASFMALLR